jgi:hypothetical protein
VYGGAGAASTANKPPKLELDGKKWVVEYFKVRLDKTATGYRII